MNKTIDLKDIIRISDALAVVVDMEADYSESDLCCNGSIIGTVLQMPNKIGVYKIIATIGTETLEGVPVIQVVDAIEELAKEYCKNCSPFYNICKSAFIDGYKAAQTKGSYSEEELRKAVQAGIIISKNYWEKELQQKEIDRYIEMKSKSNQIVELVLDIYDWSDKPAEISSTMGESNWGSQYVGKPKEKDGVIIPVSIKYAS